MSDFIQKLFTSYKERTDGDTRIGERNRIWYDSINNVFRIQLDNTPGGTIIGGGSGGGDYTLPTASTTVKGGVKIDGTTITINNQVISGFSGSYTDLTNKPTIPSAQVNSDWTASSGVAQILNKPTLFDGAYDSLTGKPTLFSGSYTDLTNKPTIPDAYTLPTATDSILGGVKIGSNISINAGVISVAAPFSGSYTDLTNKPTIPAAQIQSDWTQTNNASLDYIKNKPTIPDITNIEDTLAATGEPMGHEDSAQSTISFDSTSRTFTITPVAANFEVWVRGTKHTYTTAQSVTIPNTSGIYYIYFDSNGLGAQTDFFIWDEQAPTALVYYNAVTGLAPYFADERHGTTLDWQTHEYLHRTRGAVIANGFSVGSYTIGGVVQLDIANGTFFDEDLQIDVTHSNTPTANTWQQDLQGPAQIPMFYLSGTGWVRDNPTGYLNKQGTSRPRYNSLSGGVWSVADIDNNKYGTTFIVATNNLTYPIIAIMSQSAHANQGDAEALEFSDLVLTGFPVAEFRLLYKVVFKADSTHGHLTSVWDLRQLSATTPSAAIGSDHGLLSGLGDDDHPQYLLRTEAPTTVTVNGTSITLGSSGTVTADANTLTGTTLKSTVVTSSLTSVGTLTSLTVNSTSSTAVSITADGRPGSDTNNWSFVSNQSIGGPRAWIQFPDSTLQTTAYTGSAPVLTTARNINGVGFDGSADITVTADASTLTGTTLKSTVVTSSLTSVGTLTSLTSTGSVTANHTTAFIAGDNAISNVALQIPREGAIRNIYNGAANNMYFDVSVGGASQGQFQFRSSSAFTNVLTMSPTAFNINTEAVVTARTPSFGRLPWNSAIDTELTIDDYRFRVTNSGGIFPQIISNVSGQTRNSAWTAVGAISGDAIKQAGSTGNLVPNNSWVSLYTLHGMDSPGDTVTVTLQDKQNGRIYRVTFMRSDDGSTTGYNIIAERLL